jgi:quercetin dioxygenase-like cupin family protein
MAGTRVDFPAQPWEGWGSGSGARVKIARAGGQQARLFEMAPGFVEPEWCARGHVGYVVMGEYVTDLDDETWTMRAGQAFILPGGTRHRSRNAGSLPAIVFLVDLDVEPAMAPRAGTVGDEGLA